MKERVFGVIALMAIVLGVALPVQALPTVCFQDQLGDTYVVAVVTIGGSFFSLAGEVVGATNGIIAAGTSFPLVGSAHLRADGKAHFGISVPADDPINFPFWAQGTVNPPSFNSGSGFADALDGFFSDLTFSPAACPVLPE